VKILLTGATSGLGRNAADYLLAGGHNVVAVGRDPVQGARLAQLGAQFVPRDLTAIGSEDYFSLVKNCDAVWHCAAKSSPWGSRDDFYQNNVQVTQQLAQAAGRAQIPRFVHISTPAVYFDFRHHYDLPERYLARRFSSHYAGSKYAAEQVIATAVSQFAATRFTLLRPRGLFGPYDNVIVPRIMQQLRRDNGVLRLPRGGEALLDLTFVQNVVHAMMLATTAKTLPSGSIYNVTNHHPQRLNVMLDALLRGQLGLRYRLRSVPWQVLSLAARGMEAIGHCLDKEPPVTRYSAGAVCFDMTLSSQKAIAELGYRPPFSMAEGIALTGEWIREHGKNYRV